MAESTRATERSIRARYIVLVAANLSASGFGFATASLIALHFHAADFGSVSLAMAVTAYAVLLTNFGTELLAVKSVAAGSQSAGAMASSVMLVRLALAVPAYGLVVAVALWVPQLADTRSLLLLFGLSVFTTAFTVTWLPQALHRTNIYAFANFAIQALSFCGLLLGIEILDEIAVVPITRLVAEALVAAWLVLWMIRRVGPFVRPFPARELRNLVAQSAPIGGTLLLRGLALGSDLVILSFLVSKTEVGHYAAAFKIFLGLTALASAYFVILLPRMAAYRNDAPGMLAELRRSLRRVLPVFTAGAVLLALIAKPLLEFLFGPGFGAGAPSLRVLCLALLTSIVYRHYRQVLLARDLQTTDLRTSAICGIAHVGFKVALIPALGILGAAVGTLLGDACLLALQRSAALRELE